MTRRCLVHLFAPQNMLPAAAAVRWYGIQRSSGEQAGVTTLLYMPGWDEAEWKNSTAIITKLCASQNWPPPIVIPSTTIERIVGAGTDLNFPGVLDSFRTLIDDIPFDEFYFSHNIVGHLAELVMRAYPRAAHITYGENLGWVLDKSYVKECSSHAPAQNPPPSVNGPQKEPEASKAVLILPVDQTGEWLTNKELFVVPRLLAQTVLTEFKKAIPELTQYAQTLRAGTEPPHFLFILGNLADGGSASEKSEVELYYEIMKRHIPPRAAVFLKGHPLARIPIAQKLAEHAEPLYRCRVISSEFGVYPIELWDELIKESRIISISYSAVSIKFLCNKDVIYGLDTGLIEKYIDPRLWMHFKDGDMTYRAQLESLEKWNGKGVMWSGRRLPHSAGIPAAEADNSAAPRQISEIGKVAGISDAAKSKHRQALELYQSGKREEALRILQEAHKMAPEDPGLTSDLGLMQVYQGKLQEGIQCLTKARQMSPEDPDILKNLFEVLHACGQVELARAACLSFLQAHPDNLQIQQLALKMHGSWMESASYVKIHPRTVLGGSSNIHIRYRPLHPGVCVEIGDYSQFFGSISIERIGATVKIGDRTQIGGSSLIAAQEITIGNDVLVAWNVTILDNDSHSLIWENRREDVMQCWKDWVANPQDFIRNKDWSNAAIKPIHILDKAWIGFGVSILKGVTIGEGAVVAANSVVVKDVPPYSLAAGNPAKVIRSVK